MRGLGDFMVLITGGAGYIGSLLTYNLLASSYKVRVFDNLMYGGESLLGAYHNPNFEFIKGDIRNKLEVENAIKGCEVVVHLAAIVGYPVCKANPDAAIAINREATKQLVDICQNHIISRFVFASTYSNYGRSEDEKPVTEASPLLPQSLYAETKIDAEKYILSKASNGFPAVVLRFATVFGVSPRTRFDLMVNQFTAEAVIKKKLVVYQPEFQRSFVHVQDVTRAIQLALELPGEKVAGEIFNVGGDLLNYTKRELANLVQKIVGGVQLEFIEAGYDGDMRSISVSYNKIKNQLGFRTTKEIDDGIVEVKNAIDQGVIADPFSPKYREKPGES